MYRVKTLTVVFLVICLIVCKNNNLHVSAIKTYKNFESFGQENSYIQFLFLPDILIYHFKS